MVSLNAGISSIHTTHAGTCSFGHEDVSALTKIQELIIFKL